MDTVASIAVYDVKIGMHCKLNEYMEILSPIKVTQISFSSTVSDISSEITGPIKVKCHVDPPWDGGTKVCSNDPSDMTKMAANLIQLINIRVKSYLLGNPSDS